MTDRYKFTPSVRHKKILAVCLVALLSACAPEDPQHFVQEGMTLFEKGDMEGARVQFQNALQANPKLAEAYYGLALVDEKKPDLMAMRKDLQEVVALDPANVNAQAKLGLLLADQLEKSKEQLAIAKKLDAENISTMVLEATLTLREGNKVEALQQIEQIFAKDGGNVDAVRLQTIILASDKRYDDALTALNQGIDANPKEAGLGLLKVRLHREQGQFDEVVRDYEELLAKHPNDKRLREDQIQILTQIGKFDLAEQALRDSIGKDSEDSDLKLRLVNFVESRDTARAETILKEFIAANPGDLKLKTRLAGYYLGHKRNSDAEVLLKEIVATDAKGKDGLTAKVRLAESAWARNDKAGAEKLTEEVITADGGNSGALLFRASMRLAKQDIDGAVSDLRIVLRNQPNSDQAMILMAQAYAMKGETEVAESHWRKALEANPSNLAALAPLTSALFNRGDAVRAEELITKSLKVSPSNPTVLELLVQARAAQKNWVGAQEAVNELRKQPQAALAADMLEGMLAASQGHHQDAIRTYKEILAQKPGAAEALVAMARSYEATGKRAEFITFLQAFIKQNPNIMPAYHALGMAHAKESKWADAGNILQQALKQEPKSLATYRLLADVLVQDGKAAEVPALYANGLIASPDNPELMLELAKFYDGSKDYAAAIAAYTGLLNKYPDNDEAANNLAYLLAEFGNSPERLERAVALAKRFKDSPNPYFLDTYGWALFKSGKANEAAESFKKAVAVVPGNAEFHYHLGEAYFAANDRNAARSELQKTLSVADKQREFTDIEKAKELLKQLAD